MLKREKKQEEEEKKNKTQIKQGNAVCKRMHKQRSCDVPCHNHSIHIPIQNKQSLALSII